MPESLSEKTRKFYDLLFGLRAKDRLGIDSFYFTVTFQQEVSAGPAIFALERSCMRDARIKEPGPSLAG
ncbi:MAG: hypothetical protein U5L00_17005 [Desulfovermiculus sp.]|nr:hypothetical protein [Desulfovermiculus sp.]